uniref:Uncharacterized protein n=1 Tax=Leersia perrieri TaxID=77586 RepID=A0A0D9XL01_9ORYZ
MPPAPSAAFPHRRHLLLRLRLPPFTCCRYRPLRHHTAADPTRRCIRRSTSMSPPPIHLATPHRRSTSAPRHAASQIHRSINALPHLPIHLAAPRHDLQGRPAMSTASTTNTKTRGVPIVDARTEAEAKKIYNISKMCIVVSVDIESNQFL